MIVQEPVKAAIWHCLDHYDYRNAVFLSERLYAEVDSEDTLYLLATSYYRSGQKTQAYKTLKNRCDGSTQCQLLFAICAVDLEKYNEAEFTLLHKTYDHKRTLDDVVKDFGDQAAFALTQLGKIALKTFNETKAIEAWKKALEVNPFLYCVFEDLCQVGEKLNPSTVFHTDNIENFSMCQSRLVNTNESFIITNESTENHDCHTPQIMYNINAILPNRVRPKPKELYTPEDNSLNNSLVALSGFKPLPVTGNKNLLTRMESIMQSPSFGYLDYSIHDNNMSMNFSTPTSTETKHHQTVGKRLRSQIDQINRNQDSILQNYKPVLSQSSNVPVTKSSITTQPDQNIRRSLRLFSSPSVKENNTSPTRNKFVTPKSPSKKTKPRFPRSISSTPSNGADNEPPNKNIEKSETITSESKNMQNSSTILQQAIQMQKQSADGLMTLLKDLGQASVALSNYDCPKAIQLLESLPPQHFNTPWIYSLVGVAYFEMNDYVNCIKYFEKVHSMEPYWFDYMDIYSTALWHLQKEIALSALAQDLINTDRNHPVTWCVSGNCFSLQMEHDTAIKHLQRAVQVDKDFTYAYTLLGHEYITTEELDKAMNCFRTAIRLDPHHYNAWFGLGIIYSKQERYKFAEYHFGRALEINPKSSVVLCHIGVVSHALKQTGKALSIFNRAIEINPKSALCKFHRASVYFALERHDDALKELEELKQMVPKESSVYYLIGKIHKKLGNTHLALQHFSWATDLDPKGASSHIKESFDATFSEGEAESIQSPQSPMPDDFQLLDESNSSESV